MISYTNICQQLLKTLLLEEEKKTGLSFVSLFCPFQQYRRTGANASLFCSIWVNILNFLFSAGSLFTIPPQLQPRSQGLCSSRPLERTREDGDGTERRDPGNEVAPAPTRRLMRVALTTFVWICLILVKLII